MRKGGVSVGEGPRMTLGRMGRRGIAPEELVDVRYPREIAVAPAVRAVLDSQVVPEAESNAGLLDTIITMRQTRTS